MAVEFELKYRASAQAFSQLQSLYAPILSPIEMETTYYDTPSGALSQRHYTLRLRRENGVCVCTLKTPAPFGRNEWEVQSEDIFQAVPMLCKLEGSNALSSLTAEGLLPICGAKFTRLAGTLDLTGAVIELALDKGVLTAGEKTLPFLEAEVELKSGESALAIAFARSLARQYSLTEEPLSKFRRAFLLRGDK